MKISDLLGSDQGSSGDMNYDEPDQNYFLTIHKSFSNLPNGGLLGAVIDLTNCLVGDVGGILANLLSG